MLTTDKPWKPEAVLLLGAGVLFSLSSGVLVLFAVKRWLPNMNPADLRFAEFLIGTASLQGAALLFVHVFLRHHGVTWREFLGLDRPGLGRTLLRALATTALATPLVLILADWCKPIILRYQETIEPQPAVQVMEIAVGPARRALFTFASVVLAPVAEELLFRGVLYAVIRQQGYPRLALIVSSVVFSAIHVSLLAFLPFIVLALILALLYERTGSLLAPIVAHAGFNAVNVIAYSVVNTSQPGAGCMSP